MIAIYPDDTPFPVYHPQEWWGDTWDGLDYGREFSFERPFFEQWGDLMMQVPRIGVDIVNCENCDYCNYCGDNKNCYLDIAGEGNEDCCYNLFTKYSKDCLDNTFVYSSELSYGSINCYDCFNVSFGYYLENCSDCLFSFDLKGCNNCLFSRNLRNKDYYVFNSKVSKSEYQRIVRELDLGSYKSLLAHLGTWKKIIAEAVHRDMNVVNSENCTGDNIKNSKNCHTCFNITNCEDSEFLYDVLDAKDCRDLNYSLYHPEASYELISTLQMKFSAFCMASHYCSDSYYVDQCNNSSQLFGCIGLNQKSCCVLNKQYSQEEYESLLPKIIEHMQKTGEWGEFFPASLSPWAYNETVASEYFPLSKEEVLGQGYSWREKSEPRLPEAMSAEALSDHISEIDNEILSRALVCEESGRPFRIIKKELDFYRKQNLPIPRSAPDARHLIRLSMRNPRRLYQRKCDDLGIPITSTYSPDRPERVLSETAYLKSLI